jgi:hypothetical protein
MTTLVEDPDTQPTTTITIPTVTEPYTLAPATLVVVHPAEDGWDAYISGRAEAVRIDGPADLNHILDGLGIRYTTLCGIAACDAPHCGNAATAATLTATPDAYLLTRACTTHQATIPADGHQLPGHTVARPAYIRRFATDIAALSRALLAHAIPPDLFDQPACTHCGLRIAPDPDMAPRLTWRAGDGSAACTSEPPRTHEAAPSPAEALITRYVQDIRGQLRRGAQAMTDRAAA